MFLPIKLNKNNNIFDIISEQKKEILDYFETNEESFQLISHTIESNERGRCFDKDVNENSFYILIGNLHKGRNKLHLFKNTTNIKITFNRFPLWWIKKFVHILEFKDKFYFQKQLFNCNLCAQVMKENNEIQNKRMDSCLNKKSSNIDKFIYVMNFKLEDNFCDKIIDIFNSLEFNLKSKSNSQFHLPLSKLNIPELKDIDNKMFSIFNTEISKFLLSVLSYEVKKDRGYIITKTFGPVSPIDTLVNEISNVNVIIQLNDDYCGGELYFPLENHMLRLQKGEILIYPSIWTHEIYSMCLQKNTNKYSLQTSLL